MFHPWLQHTPFHTKYFPILFAVAHVLLVSQTHTDIKRRKPRGKLADKRKKNWEKIKLIIHLNWKYFFKPIKFLCSCLYMRDSIKEEKKYILVFTWCTKSVLKQYYYEVRGINEAWVVRRGKRTKVKIRKVDDFRGGGEKGTLI